jgi:hypothetical protein
VFPFVKFPGVDTILGPEMKSTGEVMGVGKTFGEAFVKSQLGAGTGCRARARPSSRSSRATRRVRCRSPPAWALGFELVATKGTSAAIVAAGIPCQTVNKVTEGRPHIVDMIKNNEIALVVNTVEERRNAIADSRQIRTSALLARVTTFTTIAGAEAAVEGMKYLDSWTWSRCRKCTANSRHNPPSPPDRACALAPARPGFPFASVLHGNHSHHPRGAEKLKAELHRLKTVDRPAVISAIAEARAQGDLSENAEYDAAKDRQGFIEGRIQEVEGKLSMAQIIDPSAGRRRAGGVRRHGRAGRRGRPANVVKLPDRRRGRGRPQAGPGQHQQPDRACADRQGRGRHRRSGGARRHPALRDRRRPLPLRREWPGLSGWRPCGGAA